jgi:hypothetical protein
VKKVEVDRLPALQRGMDKEPILADHYSKHTMASTIHTARHLPAGNQTIPLFTLRGLDNYAPVPISHIGIHGTPLQRQVAYTQYAYNIASFLFATDTKTTIPVTGRPLGTLRYSQLLPIPSPSVHFTLKKGVNSDMSTKLLNALGPGSATTISGKTTIFQAPVLPNALIDSIVGLCPSHFNCGRDAVNPSGALAFRFLSSVCHAFLRTHSYPAFSEETEESLMELNMLLAGKTKYILKKGKDDKGKDIDVFDPAAYSRVLSDLKAGESGSMDVDDTSLVTKLRGSAGRIVSSGNDAVLNAKPCPVPQTNIGTRAEAPNLPGILFPYFHGLIQPDAVFLHSTILSHFFQLMGTTVQNCQEMFLILRRGCGSLSTTKEGMMITHLIKGILLALETQSRCYMLYEANEYKGFVLYGAQFVIFDSTKWIVPGSEEELRDALNKLDPHEASVGNLVRMLGELKTKDMYSGPTVTSTTFQEPKNLIDVFRGLKLYDIDDDDIKELDKYLRGLNYMGSGYWARNPQTIVDALKIIASEGSVKLERPTYFSSVRLPIHTKEYAALSKFGPESFSLWNERGTDIVCKASETQVVSGGKRKAGEVDLYANMPNRIFVTPKPLGVAVSDMTKVVSKGMIKIDLGERAGKYRNICVESEEMKKSMWRELIEVSREAHTAKKAKVLDASDENDFDALMFKLTSEGGALI